MLGALALSLPGPGQLFKFLARAILGNITKEKVVYRTKYTKTVNISRIKKLSVVLCGCAMFVYMYVYINEYIAF